MKTDPETIRQQVVVPAGEGESEALAVVKPTECEEPAEAAAVAVTVEDKDEEPASEPLLSAAEHERLLHDAYLRGRNEAIAAATAADTATVALYAENRTPGIDSTATPPSDPVLARLFRHRPSVWD